MSRLFHRTMLVVVLAMLVISAVGMWAYRVRVPALQVLPKVGLYALVLVGAAFYKYRQVDSFYSALMIVFWAGLISDLHIYPMFIIARIPQGYHDALAARADQFLG